MFHHLRGTLYSKSPEEAVVEAGGLGYAVRIPLSTYEALPEPGAEALVHTHLHVREDLLRLYGFATPGERRFFQVLLEVSGIGPAVALSILSSSRYEDFRDAVLAENASLLTRLKGVGKKLAERMVFELREKLAKEAPGREPAGAVPRLDLRDDAVEALLTLGFHRGAAAREVDRLLARPDAPRELGEIIREVLRTAR